MEEVHLEESERTCQSDMPAGSAQKSLDPRADPAVEIMTRACIVFEKSAICMVAVGLPYYRKGRKYFGFPATWVSATPSEEHIPISRPDYHACVELGT